MMIETLEEKRAKLREEMLKEFEAPVDPHGTPEHKRIPWVIHPECPYAHPKSGLVSESRYVWWLNHPEDPILYGEVIHHINGNRKDNRIENLAKLPWSGHARLKVI